MNGHVDKPKDWTVCTNSKKGVPEEDTYPLNGKSSLNGALDTQVEDDGPSCDTETVLLDGSTEVTKDGSTRKPHENGDSRDGINEGTGITYDSVVKMVGEFGPYQKRVCLLLCLPSVSGCIQILLSVFTLAVPDHRCALPGLANDTWAKQSAAHDALIHAYIPSLPTDAATCRVYDPPLYRPDNLSYHSNGTSNASSDGSWNGGLQYQPSENGNSSYHGNSSNTVLCSSYVYDTSTYTSTVVTQMDLVCEKALYRSHPQMLTMVGSLVGSQSTFLADVWGRKTVLMIFVVTHIVSSFALTWVQSYPIFLALMFPIGASVSGMLCPAFVLAMELVGPSARRVAGYGVMIFWSLGMIILAPLAYLIRDWQYLQLATSLLPVPFLSFFWLLPESPRWLLTKGHVDKAETIIMRAAHVNKRSLPSSMIDKVSVPADQQHSWRAVLMACTNRRLVIRYLMIFYIWMVCSLAYYGLSWNVGSLAGSVYINFLLSGVMEIVSLAFCIFALDRVGRRVLNCGLMVLAGVTCTATLFPVLFAPSSSQWITVVLAMAGKLGITGAFNTAWLFTSELFPTVIRNSGIGISSVFARVGGIMAPYIANLGQLISGDAATAVPLVIFGVSSMLAAILLLCLPETLNRSLPETVQDAANMGRKNEKEYNKTVAT